MSVREKLVELLDDALLSVAWGMDDYPDTDAAADVLISNGVTVKKWIPVSERLPEDDSPVLVARKNGDVDTDMYINAWWKVGPVERNITHWMPLLEPPKECE